MCTMPPQPPLTAPGMNSIAGSSSGRPKPKNAPVKSGSAYVE